VFLLLLMGFVIVNDITKTAAEWSGGGNNKQPTVNATPAQQK